ncbi:MAG: choice-of-anchor J domain-containing protein [Rubrivivax sp.]|nr:choice-of-anchor J domain-containing protein [Rubrivivax sp.]
MTIKQLMSGLALVAAASGAHANTLLSEGFDNVATLGASGWVQVNNSTAPLGSSWFQGNSGIFAAASGAPNSYIAANFLSTGSATGAVSNWLMTPELSLDSTGELSFLVRTAGDGFLDMIEVRLSTSGASANVADFSTLLGSFQASSDTGWVGLSYTLYGVDTPTTGRLAFRYLVDNVSTAGNYLGIDDVVVTSAIPEPTTYLLMGLGVAGLMLRRRFTA